MSALLRLHNSDNVAVAVRSLCAGSVEGGVTLLTDVPAGHKVALQAIPAGAPAIKYGYPIGVSIRPISPGEHVHSHNLKSALDDHFAAKQSDRPSIGAPHVDQNRTFEGFRRPGGGRVGIRNEIWI